MNSPIVFLDTETDGVHPGRKVYEIAMIRRETNGQRTETQFFVDIDLATADKFGLAVGKFYDRHPIGRTLSAAAMNDSCTNAAWEPVGRHDGRMLNQAAAAMRVARWTHDAHIVGAVPNFDTELLDGLLRENGLIPAWHYHLIDVENLAAGWLAAGGAHAAGFTASEVRAAITPPWKSDELSRILGVEPPTEDERHTALGDARWAERLYDRIYSART